MQICQPLALTSSTPHHLHAALVARLFRIGDAYPTAFSEGEWSALFLPSATRDEKRCDISSSFSLLHTSCLPLRAQQSLYQLVAAGLPLGVRTGSSSLTAGCCPTCVAAGRWVHHTHEHLILTCPLALRLWQVLLYAWTRAFPRQVWASPLVLSAGGDTQDPPAFLPLEVRRAVCLGLRPPSQCRDLVEPFALLRGAVLAVLLQHHWRAEGVASVRGVDTVSAPAARDALVTRLRATVIADYQHAVRCERARALRANSVLMAAGCDIGPDNDAFIKWRRVWADSGVCSNTVAATLQIFR